MKRITKSLLVGIFMLASISAVNAQNYKHSIGVVVGTMDGVSYKTFFSENLALKADLAYKYTVTYGGKYDYGYGYSSYNSYVSTFELNPNFLYQKNITSFGWGDLDWYAGGGVSIGYAFGGYGYSYGYGYGRGYGLGKFGVNASGGVELALTGKVPLAFDSDFRPGYGLLFGRGGTGSYFDWALTFGVRYCF